MKYKKILIIQTAFPGDVVLTLPLLQVLKKNFPESKIDFLLIPQTKNLLENNSYVSDVIVYDKREGGFSDLMQLANSLRDKQYDLIISPHRSFRSAFLSKYASAKKTISFDKSSAGFLYDERVKYKDNSHEIQRNLKLLEPIGIHNKEIISPELFPGKDDVEKVTNFLKSNGIIGDETFITIAPGSVWFTKRFPKEKFVRLLELPGLKNQKIILIGGDADREIAEYIVKNTGHKNVINAAGNFSFLQSSELIRRSRALITNDSAPLHIGNAVGTKVISIFGATIPQFGFYPTGKDDIVIETLGLSCRPCSIHGGTKCPIGTFVCMNNIDERRIADRIK